MNYMKLQLLLGLPQQRKLEKEDQEIVARVANRCLVTSQVNANLRSDSCPQARIQDFVMGGKNSKNDK